MGIRSRGIKQGPRKRWQFLDASNTSLTLQAQTSMLLSGIPGVDPQTKLKHVLNWFPVVDDDLITASSSISMTVNKPLLLGIHHDEAMLLNWVLDRLQVLGKQFSRLFPFLPRLPTFRLTPRMYRLLLTLLFGSKAPVILRQYPASLRANETTTTFWRLISDNIFICPNRRVLEDSLHPSTYGFMMQLTPRYLEDVGGGCTNGQWSCHVVEIPYMFHSGYTLVQMSPEEHLLSQTWIRTWLKFSKEQNENDGKEIFPGWAPDRKTVFQLENDVQMWHRREFPHHLACDMWDRIGYDF